MNNGNYFLVSGYYSCELHWHDDWFWHLYYYGARSPFIFGIGGAVRGLFLTAFDLPKEVYIATAGAIALIIDTTRLTTYFVKGARLEHLLLWGLIVFIPASFSGAKIAQLIVNKIPQQHFRKIVAVFLFLVGIKLLLLPK